MQAQAQVSIFHDGQAFVKALHSLECGCPAEQRLVPKQAAQAPASMHKPSVGRIIWQTAAAASVIADVGKASLAVWQ